MICQDTSCTACPLHVQAKSVCVPSTQYPWSGDWPTHRGDIGQDRALFMIGEAPGYHEDQCGLPWVGRAGEILIDRYIDFFCLRDRCDIYLSNAVRCRPPENKTPTKTQLKMCQGFYLADILDLQQYYDEVIVLALGGPAIQSVLGMSLKKSLTRQGDFTDFRSLTAKTPKSLIRLGEVVGPYLDSPTAPPFSKPCRVFTTYHPAALLRDPNKGPSIHAHLANLRDFLDGRRQYEIDAASLDIDMAPRPPTYAINRLSLDIETYGILGGQNQTQFHPLKSEVHDGITRDKLVVCVGLTHRDPDGKAHHSIFLMDQVKHRQALWSWIKKCHQQSDFEALVGQNIKFDLMYLRHAYPECKPWLDHPLPLTDLIIWNYLHDEGRPERSLKALAPLLGVTKYDSSGFIQYPAPASHSLHQYCCQDTFAVLMCVEKLEALIASLYSSATAKLTPFSRQWYSNLLWLTTWMEEAGVSCSTGGLQNTFDQTLHRLSQMETALEMRWTIRLGGKGSDGIKREIMESAMLEAQEYVPTLPKLEKTGVRKVISFREENRNALLDVLPSHTQSYKKLRSITRIHHLRKTLDSFLYPLLVGRGKNHSDPTTTIIKGICYPRWYPVPSDWEDGSSGGTKQARIIAKGPAIQTFPRSVKRHITGRFPGGYLIWFDYSQIELRVAALLSNDPWMMSEYAKRDCDFHLATAIRLFGEADGKKLRQLGKTLNFLTIYLGGGAQYQRTLMKMHGIYRDLNACQQDINQWWAGAGGLRRWQNETMDFVLEHGYFELPLIGQSRLYLGSKRQRLDCKKEVVNMPVQAIAANIMLSGQFELAVAFRRAHLRSVIPLNIYDAASIESPGPELKPVQRLMNSILPNPPYYRALCTELGRTLPLKFDTKIIPVPLDPAPADAYNLSP